ncbi:hypothetical protein VPH35_005386 [Triticum aestivum]
MAATGTKQQQPTATPVATPTPPAEVGGAEPKESVLSRTTRQVAERVQRMEEEANRRKQEEEKKPAPAAKKDQHPRPKAPQAATAAAATPEKQGSAIGKKDKAAVDRESLEDRVRLCGDGEEVRAKAAATPTAMDAKAEHEKKAAAATCTAWKERIVGELKGLTDMKWADNTFEIARKNKEVVAVGVAAFSLGFFVSQRLFGNEPGAATEENAKPTPPTEVDGAKKMPREEGAAKLTPQAEVDGAKKMSKEEGAVKPPPTPASHQLPSKDGGAGKKETNGAKQPAATRDDGGEKKEAVVGTEPKESTLGKTTRQVAEHVHRMEEAKRRKQIEHMPAPAAKKEEEVKPKAPQPAAAAMTPEKPAPKAEVANGEKAKAAVDRESLAERVSQRGEEERAKAAATATATEAKAEQAKKAVPSTCTAWKERIAGELKGLADMKWADNAVEMARRNKEVVAVGVAAFSIGFLVSQKLFRK